MESDSNSTGTDLSGNPDMQDFAFGVAIAFFALNIIFIVCAIHKMSVGRERTLHIQMKPINRRSIIGAASREKD